MKLYPRLRLASAQQLANERAGMAYGDLVGCAGPTHPEAFFAPTGGERVTVEHLEQLRAGLEEIAARAANSHSDFDFDAATFLLREMGITPVESARPEVWACFSLTLVPHLVHRRFADSTGRVNPERYVGGQFGGRNAFGRLWWRAYLLREEDAEDPFRLLRELGEDQMVQILERPRVSGYGPLARSIADVWAERARSSGLRVPAEALMRDAMKRVRRLSAFIAWELLEDAEVREVIADVFERSEGALARHAPTDETNPDTEVQNTRDDRLPAHIPGQR